MLALVKEEVLLESRSARSEALKNANAQRILEKVKALSVLPDGLNVTVEMAANYYEVSRDAIKQVISRNNEELTQDGLKVLGRNELSDMISMENVASDMVSLANIGEFISSKTRSLTLIPRRALLRIGMVLRDSEVAKAVRTALLDAERSLHSVSWAKISREIEALEKMYKSAGHPKTEARRKAILLVQERFGLDLSEFLPPDDYAHEHLALRVAEYIDRFIVEQGGSAIRPYGVREIQPPDDGWYGFWVDAEHTKVAFYPTKFDDLLKERGYGANVVRKTLIEEGKIEKGDKTSTLKYDAETKKMIRAILYRNT